MPDALSEHAFTNLSGLRLSMVAKRNGPTGLRLTPVVTVRIEDPDGNYSQISVPAVAAAAFARVLDVAVRERAASDAAQDGAAVV